MKQTIAISAFAEMLARQSGYTSDFCEHFVVEMFKTIADSLKEASAVSVKGLGTFTVDDSGNVGFIPDSSFATDVNAPFDCFEPEPLDDDVTDEMLSMDDTLNNAETVEGIDDTDEEIAPEDISDAPSNPECNEVAETIIDDCPMKENTSDEGNENESDIMVESGEQSLAHKADETPETERIEQTPVVPDDYPEGDGREKSKRRSSVWAFLCGTACGAIVGAAVTYMVLVSGAGPESEEQIILGEQQEAEVLDVENTTADRDSTNQLPAVTPEQSIDSVCSSDTVIYDTVTTTLAQLSRKHYGSYEFWVYIYEENKDVISDPDRVEPDTRVRIPDAEKYGIDANNRASINNALKKSREITRQNKR
ncbi:MAG: HU family DNA-binding protein [Muribaculaceae bacterium]|nr:HU family DNA-binding protein [Muribaculaceae bacterium]